MEYTLLLSCFSFSKMANSMKPVTATSEGGSGDRGGQGGWRGGRAGLEEGDRRHGGYGREEGAPVRQQEGQVSLRKQGGRRRH